MSLTKKATSSIRWTGLTSVTKMVVSFLQVVILARILSPEDFGLMAIVVIVVSIGNVFVNSSFSDAIISKDVMTEDQKSTLYFLNVLFGFSIFSIVFLSSNIIGKLFGLEEIGQFLKAVSIVFILASLTVQFEALLKKNLLFKPLSVITVLSTLASFFITIYFAFDLRSVWALVYGAISQQFILTFLLFIYGVKRKWGPKLVVDLSSIKDYLVFGAYRMGAAFINQINSRADQFVIGTFLGPALLGYFSISFQLVIQPFSRINPILTQVSFPVFAMAKRDNEKLVRGYCKGLRLLTAINAPLLLGFAVLAPLLIPIVLGDGWDQVVPLVQVLSIYVLLRSAGNINIGLILAKEKFKWPLYWNLIILFFIPASLACVAIVSKSILSVSVALVVIQLFLFFMGYYLFARSVLGGFFMLFISSFFLPLSIACVMAIGVYLVQSFFIVGNVYIDLILCILFGAFLYVFLIYFLYKDLFLEIKDILFHKIKT